MHQRHTLREHASGIERLALARREESAIAGWLREWEQRGNRGLAATEAVAKVLRSHKFDTVLGHIGFDAKGDVTGYETVVWNVWKGGKFAPVESGKLTE
jgi:ABC-type branched-subunit amino acid transport system substrate-binding protein